jgi:undecaprenyl-diphosphatase
VLAGVLWQSWGPVVLAAVTIAGGAVLTAVFKAVLGRPRPPLGAWLPRTATRSRPPAARLGSWAARVATWAAAVALAALVGISRVYLGVRWTTDVLGGRAFGACWLAVVITGWITLTRHLTAGRLPSHARHRPLPARADRERSAGDGNGG